MAASETSASVHSDTPDLMLSSAFQATFNAMFKSQSIDSVKASTSTGSSSGSSSATFYSLPDEEQPDEVSPQALIAIVDGILGPIQEPLPGFAPRNTVVGGGNSDPIPQPPPTPPRTPPPGFPRPPPQQGVERDHVAPWDVVSDDEEAMEAEWESL